MVKSKVTIIQDELGKTSGPIAKFVVSKQIVDLNEKEEDFPDELLVRLIDLSLRAGIYDTSKHEGMRNRIWKAIDELDEEP